jgi:hypothetical protein
MDSFARLTLLAPLLLLGGCAAPVHYLFAPESPFQDPDFTAEAAFDPTGAGAVALSLTNRTDQPLQIDWAQVTLTPEGAPALHPRPERDLGWLAPGAHLETKLVPFTLPRAGDDTHRWEGRRFTLDLPATVRREARHFALTFTAHVTAEKERR